MLPPHDDQNLAATITVKRRRTCRACLIRDASMLCWRRTFLSIAIASIHLALVAVQISQHRWLTTTVQPTKASERASFSSPESVSIYNVSGVSSSKDGSQPANGALMFVNTSYFREEGVFVVKGKTLALVEPQLLGGFRNQHMRFVALLVHASQNNIPNVLLPSIKWGDVVSKVGAMPHASLFDVEFWNRGVAQARMNVGEGYENTSQRNVVAKTAPYLVPFVPAMHSTCWNDKTELFRNVSELIVRSPGYNPRHSDLMTNISHCTEPLGYGSGKFSGRLWNDYMGLQRDRRTITHQDGTTSLSEHHPVERMTYRLLRPNKRLRLVINEVLSRQGLKIDKSEDPDAVAKWSGLLALHPRVELDMIGHKCSKVMEQNLTKIFSMIESNPDLVMCKQGTGQCESRYDRMFVAISREHMKAEGKEWRKYRQHKDLADNNMVALNDAIKLGLWNGTVPMFESGEHTAERVVEQEHIAIAAGVLNFFIAVQAEAFIGTYGSSYSTDVWTVRYYLGHGDGNYEHGKDGIKKIANGGLPRPHKCT